MIRKGTNPNGASPASRDSERARAGLMEVRNSGQRDDQLTSNRGSACRSLGLDGLFELEHAAHADTGTRSFASVISILSPTSVLVSAAVLHGSSNTEAACLRTGAKRHGFSSAWTSITVMLRSR